ncbi:hypothetical protein ACGF12_33500 [Kitasatospora sp. NPDC048296]|uniref:hypothetical protein n=1 Tax=Kitasatospora sp. NPDC048296 TaxID=3364048 RepID=UPI003721E75B
MNESARTAAAPAGSDRGRWWRAPAISTSVTLMLLPWAVVLRGLGEMATDPCTSPGPCPAVPYLAAASAALIAAVVALVLQWPASWLFQRARVAVCLVPVAALVVEVLAILNAGNSR